MLIQHNPTILFSFIINTGYIMEGAKNCVKNFYQQIMKSITAQAREPPGFRAFPQQKHLLATIMIT